MFLPKCQKEIFLNHGSPTALLGVSFIMCLHVFLFELGNYVISFVVETIVVSFEYISNKISKFAEDVQPSFFSFCLMSHILNAYVSQTFVVMLKLVL